MLTVLIESRVVAAAVAESTRPATIVDPRATSRTNAGRSIQTKLQSGIKNSRGRSLLAHLSR